MLIYGKNGRTTVRKVKNCLSQIYKYAIKCDIVSKNYGELLDIGKSPRKGQALIFTDEQIERYFNVTDSKTDAGIRQVPISDKVINIYESIVNEREKGYFTIRKEIVSRNLIFIESLIFQGFFFYK